MARSFGTGRFQFGVNIDNMWVYAGTPQPKNIDAKQVVTSKIESGIRGIFHGYARHEKSTQILQEREDAVELHESAREATSKLCSELKKARIDYVRCWFQWNFFEPKVNAESYQFPLDDFVSTLKSEDIGIVAVLSCGYSRFLPVGIDENDPVSYLNAVDKVSTAIVRHYSDSIKNWQIENEPNWWFAHVGSSWRRGRIWETAGFHDTILESLLRIVREESPSSVIIVNLEADRKRTDWKSYSKYCDVIGLDFYPNYSKPLPIDVTSFELASEVKAHTGLPVFIAETGYPSGPTYEGYSEDNQALYVAAASEEAYSSDALGAISIWRYCDSSWKSFPDQENHFGLRTASDEPKPSWNKYATQIGKLATGSDS